MGGISICTSNSDCWYVGLFIATLVEDLVPSLIGLGVLAVAYLVYTFIIEKKMKKGE